MDQEISAYEIEGSPFDLIDELRNTTVDWRVYSSNHVPIGHYELITEWDFIRNKPRTISILVSPFHDLVNDVSGPYQEGTAGNCLGAIIEKERRKGQAQVRQIARNMRAELGLLKFLYGSAPSWFQR